MGSSAVLPDEGEAETEAGEHAGGEEEEEAGEEADEEARSSRGLRIIVNIMG